MNVISFSLYGDNPIYTIGAIKNAQLAKIHFPEWTVRVYHDNTVPSDILNQLRDLDVHLHEMINDNPNKGGFLRSIWRFIPLFDSDVIYFISRDCDSRLSERDRIAVNEWITSGKRFHIVRDHPHGHGWVINAGMWGARAFDRAHEPDSDDLYNAITSFCNSPQNLQEKTLDQILLRDHIYPRIVNDAFIHDEYFKYESHCEKIKMDRASNDFAFIGESIDENDIPRGDQRSSIRERYYA